MRSPYVAALANKLGEKYGIDANVILAIAHVESALDQYAVRFEANYKWTVTVERYAKLLGITAATEQVLQRMSWGPMQLMGANARGFGFEGHLTQLAGDVEAAMDLSVQFLQQRYKLNEPDMRAIRGWSEPAIAAYNAGSAVRLANGRWANEDYVKRVRKEYDRLRLS